MRQETALGILKTGRNVYLTGAAGSGKTYVLNQYIDYLRANDVGVAVTASTGIAATHLGGQTIHAWSGIGVRDHLGDYDLDALSQKQYLVRRLERTDVLIIDEVSMLHPDILDMVDAVARELKRTPEPFGGMQIVLAGDFFQLPPVVRGGTSDVFADSAQSWHHSNIRVCYLSEQHRQGRDPLARILNDIRSGTVSGATHDTLNECTHSADGKKREDAVRLYTHNHDVDAENARELAHVPGRAKLYHMTSRGRAPLVEALKRGVLAPETLELKEGAKVMFVKNDTDGAYVNGTLGVVVSIDGAHPTIETRDGERITAEPVDWEVVEDGKTIASVTQVPLRLAWAITVHKSQGMSLDAVDVDLSKAFVPGQGYVALSRARTLEGIVLRGLNEAALAIHPYVHDRDAVFREESEKWEHTFEGFSAARVREMHDSFLERVGGRTKSEPRTPTHQITRDLIGTSATLRSVAEHRGVTTGTIIGHLEKLKAEGERAAFAHLAPPQKHLSAIKAAFDTHGPKLTPVRRALKNAYSFEDLRLARLFFE